MTRDPDQRSLHSPDGRASGLTDVGLVRRRNEDAFLVRIEQGVLIVADGLGGLPAGDVASRTAVARAAASLEQAAPVLAELSRRGERQECEGQARAALEDAFREAHVAVARRGLEDASSEGMATTLVVALVAGDVAYLSHVGDVRAYVGREGRLFQLTRDDSLVGDMVAAGRLTLEQARVHPRKNVITQALGLEAAPSPSFTTVGLSVGDVLMLCSDGLWEAMPGEDLERVASAAQGSNGAEAVERTAVALADAAIAAGGNDNITVVLYRHGAS